MRQSLTPVVSYILWQPEFHSVQRLAIQDNECHCRPHVGMTDDFLREIRAQGNSVAFGIDNGDYLHFRTNLQRPCSDEKGKHHNRLQPLEVNTGLPDRNELQLAVA